MSFTAIVVFVLVAALAAVNGSNDVPKGVATLAGAGVTKYKTAIIWGTITTLLGCVFSLGLASKMTALFSKGIITGATTDAFAVAVLAGAAFWVGLATILRLPVSTTHALIGGMVGAGLLMSTGGVSWSAVGSKLVTPLLVSIVVAYAITLILAVVTGAATKRRSAATPPVLSSGSGDVAVQTAPVVTPEKTSARIMTAAHWFTSGATGFARGLNDTPKIVAIGAFALVPAGMQPWHIMILVTAAMAAGSLLGGMRVAEKLGEGVVKMNHREGFLANLTTAALVGVGAGAGLPMSTTHVSTGAIAGSAGPNLSRISGGTIRNFLIAWLVTPPVAGVVAALVFILAR
ncbi:Probable low-affinity inorganic phosphate transporter [Amycolatopsis camponoti]|uniref:Probable low-affinity inorganic phosphate transporter n=1 Tax=Amycolatopsis camponoti TaxID=2606593 RepID=A0A6I8LS98_9PSEU|nr:inorganic phosphate transporter [Amycolatopsis camponoti]VVJ18495.1 Probable low-affinity inorganic phosphate transporter [Amycolatopsis camponoti]